MKNFDKIENLVQTRQTAQAHAYIVKELRKLSHDMNFQVQVSDWYRILGLNKESLKVLKLNEISIRTNWSTQLPEGRVLTQAAFVLNQLGASAFALKIANLLHTNDPLEVSKLGEIYLANYEYSKAEICFQKALHGSVGCIHDILQYAI